MFFCDDVIGFMGIDCVILIYQTVFTASLSAISHLGAQSF